MNNSFLTKKGKSTVYTDEKRSVLLYNAKHDEAVRAKAEAYAEEADRYLDKVDFIYDSVVAEGLYRYYFVGDAYDPKRFNCRYCHGDIAKHSGMYSWKTDPFNSPWKIECPICGRKFPSNDFESYYKLGLTRDGHFDPEKAKREHIRLFGSLDNVGYLKNELYPEMDEHIDENGNVVNKGVHGWGVDDGFGYLTVNENGETERHSYIAFYVHNAVWGGTPCVNAVRTPLAAFCNAYLYTGEEKYAVAGAKILDRIADFYPEYDWYIWHEYRKDPYKGAILDPVWSCGLATSFCLYYDAFFPVYENRELIEYLSAKAKKHGTDHINPKNTADHLRKNAEDGILRSVFKQVRNGQVAGNFGTDQYALSAAAVVLNTLPETAEWLDWVTRPSVMINTGSTPPVRTGGNVYAQLIDVVDRDGMGNEASPGYNSMWISYLLNMADIVSGYELYPDIDLYKNPKFLKMFHAHMKLATAGYYTPQIGDAGAYASRGITASVSWLLSAYIATKDPFYAKAMYLINGKTSKGLRYPDTVKDPASLEKEVLDIIEAQGELDIGSILQSGYGFAALRDGTITDEKNTKRDFWMYFGTNSGHGHRDSLNLGIDAYGLNMAPELGYPKDTGTNANRIQWVSATLAHNTVIVDEKSQTPTNDRGFPLHFDGEGKVKLMDAERTASYPDITEEYRRTVLMIDACDDVSYGVDFFRIKGGKDHLYSFHSQSHEICKTTGLSLTPQNGGTYASADVPLGNDPSPLSGKSWKGNVFTYPDGYTWLDNVEKDLSPEKDFSVDFNVSDYRSVLKDSSGLHLRMTMMCDEALDEVSVVNGYPVQNSNNPDTVIKYVLARRKSKDDKALDNCFVTVFEPYKNERYISSISSVSVKNTDGSDVSGGEIVRAVKVTLTSGRTDYIVYALDNTKEYLVDGLFAFRGFAGVISFVNGEAVYAYINDGTRIGGAITDAKPAHTGTVAAITRELTLDNTLELSVNMSDEEIKDLSGKWIYIDNDKVQNGAYMIEKAKRLNNGNVLIDIGITSVIRSYKDKNDTTKGFICNVEEGQAFRIPLSRRYEK